MDMTGGLQPELDWTPWVPFGTEQLDSTVPKAPGLYMIRSLQSGNVLYVGQTGRTLRERLGALRGVHGDVMPYSDPHTAGPALWAHRIDTGETFEVRVAVLDVDKADRMGREAFEITKRRIIDGCSPTYNFGRMPDGWIKSSGNSRKLVEAGRRFRGRRMTAKERLAAPSDPSVAPPTKLDGDVRASDWLGLKWKESATSPPGLDDVGIYRISSEREGPLDYVGQGRIRSRWNSHVTGWFSDIAAEREDPSTWDWVGLDLSSHQLLEVENDLISGHMVRYARPPRMQFAGSAIAF
jgi:hypothetical protein